MGKLKTHSLLLKLKVVAEKLQKILLHPKNHGPRSARFGSSQETIRKDVKEGYFAIIAADDDEERRFVVPLVYLNRPSFQRLLEKAADEYGFNHDGALMVPCRPSELEWMLVNGESEDLYWSSCKAMIESYRVLFSLSWFA
ncbi:hypothetical protein QVD17_00886 [Tagetes erecta]|uniref:Uncharacterized protein n=1 Tax=Tagetes erecta TaxID=13708 RepID=A0AAD8L9M3_TARER|nr:hypothetical protein QVD17_00886 [Tagetes erecta]